MPRKPRIQYKGAIYHLMNRGDRREPIFKSAKDRESFLETLGQMCQKCGWQWIAERLVMGHWRSAYNAVRNANENA